MLDKNPQMVLMYARITSHILVAGSSLVFPLLRQPGRLGSSAPLSPQGQLIIFSHRLLISLTSWFLTEVRSDLAELKLMVLFLSMWKDEGLCFAEIIL